MDISNKIQKIILALQSGNSFEIICNENNCTKWYIENIIKKHNIEYVLIRKKKQKKEPALVYSKCSRCSNDFLKKNYSKKKYCSTGCKNILLTLSGEEKIEYIRKRNRDRVKAYYSTEKGGNIIKKHNKFYSMQFPEKTNARSALNYNLKAGKIVSPDFCSICKKQSNRIEGHHEDYSKPLEVIWCCKPCHYKLDKQLQKTV